MSKKILRIMAKCADRFTATLSDGKTSREYSGYVPSFFRGQHYGDNVQLEIDVATGQILNWTPPTQAELDEVFESEDDTEE